MFIHAGTLLIAIIWLPGSEGNGLLIPPNSTCACPGEVLTYTCTADGIGSTVWRGSSFACPSNEVRLLHSQFDSNSAFGTCNNEAVVGRSVGVQNDLFTSELLVTVSSDFNNESVSCIHDAASGDILVGTAIINVAEAHPPPNGIHLASVSNGTLIFEWNPINSAAACISIQYSVSSNCGLCRGRTSSTKTSCSGLRLSPNPANCTFAVTTVICENTLGIPSDSIQVTLKVPGVPELDIIPIYSSDDGSLAKFAAAVIREMEPFVPSGGVTIAVMNYNIYFNAMTFHLSSCGDTTCERITSVPSSSCPPMTNISVRASASNMLGEGPQTDPIIIECTNRFVSVQYNSSTSTISCVFLNTITTTNQLCNIDYWLCRDGRMENMRTYNLSNGAILTLTPSGTYCYLVTAVYRDVYAIRIEGIVDVKDNSNPLIPIISTVIVIVVVIGIIAAVLGTILLFRHKRIKRTHVLHKSEDETNQPPPTTLHLPLQELPPTKVIIFKGKELKLKEIDRDRFIIKYTVEKNCQLKEFIKSLGLAYRKGCVYYEFIHEETVSRDKELIFMPEGTRQYYCLDIEMKEQCNWYGEKVTPPSLKEHTVFVQSKGSGTRHLPEGSSILYELPLPVYITQQELKIIEVNENCTIYELCRDKNILYTNSHSVFVEINLNIESGRELKSDIIFMNEKTRKCFTSPFAGHVVNNGVHWKVFKSFQGALLHRGSRILLLHMVEEHLQKEDVPLISVDSANLKTEYLKEDWTVRDLHETCGPYVFVNKKYVTLTEDTPILNVVLVDNEKLDTYFTVPSSLRVFKHFQKIESRWTVFILCLLREDMKVDTGNEIVYQVTKENNYHTVGKWPVCIGSEHFSVHKVMEDDDDKSVKKFCRDQKLGSLSVFLECTYFHKDDEVKDGFLWKKDTDTVYTGPSVRNKIQKFYDNPTESIPANWKLFISTKELTGKRLKKDTSVLIYNPSYENERYHVFVVAESEHQTRMSAFIEKRLNHGNLHIDFIRGKAFYEFTEEEDLRFYRDIVYATEAQLLNATDGSLQNLKSGVHLFYEIPDKYSENAKPPIPCPNERVFIQSTSSQGSMCVKEGMIILYKVSVSETSVEDHKGIIKYS